MRKQLPDTPWHIGSPKMKESDHRRLNKWCIHYDDSICKEPKSGCYLLRCAGSSHCKYYAEDEKTSLKLEQDNRTQMEIDAENKRQYIDQLTPKMRALVSSSDGRRYIPVQSIKRCYICGSKLLDIGKRRKQCTLCHMKYIDQSSVLPSDKSPDGNFVYIMGQEKQNYASDSHDIEPCQFCDGIGRCQEKGSPLFKKRCKPEYCSKLKKQKNRIRELGENEFSGIKNIPINRVVIRTQTPPKQEKIDRAIDSIRRNGKITQPIYVELYKDKYLLKKGYIQYYAALECGLSSIPATLEWEFVQKE